ncbi:hypothetical protein DL240_15490 [Lujinxingia litoralis]|uniref:TonB-dependent receptor n=1 Tax=Lujinxingia litoralis TaxID=2211119 RepID=A0A328C448_9DELT|nr:TonB-dependent receptor [Lujinxingia litoralis]RAL20719.1 hypothetical protein DL240_15490 [Lujinxingia litoralis]
MWTVSRWKKPGWVESALGALALGAGLCAFAPDVRAQAVREPVSVDDSEDAPEGVSESAVNSAASEDGLASTLRARTVSRERSARDDARHPSGFVTRVQTESCCAQPPSLGEVLEQVEGVQLSRSSSPGQPAYVAIRGGSPRQLVVYLGGLRLSTPAGLGFDVGQFGVAGLASADVFRGGAAVVHGAGALTGSVQLNPRAPASGVAGELRLSAGSFGSAGAQAAVSAANARGGLRLHAGVRRARGDFGFVDHQGVEQGRLNNDHQRFSGGGSARLKVGEGALHLTAMVEDGEGGSPGPSEFQRAFEQARVEDDRRLANLRWETQGGHAVGWQVHADVGLQDRRWAYENPRGHMSLEPVASSSRHQTLAASLEGRLFAGRHIAGLSAAAGAERYRAAEGAASLGAERLSAALALSDEWLLADERLSLVGALRMELLREVSTEAAFEPRVYAPLTPALGVIGRVHRRLEVRANLARTFRAADFDERFLTTEAVRGNPDLEPERAWAMDAGLRLRLSPGTATGPQALELGATYFRNEIDEMILFLPVSAYVYQAQNLSGARAHGLESTLSWAPVAGLRLEGSYTLTRAYLKVDQGAGSPAQLPHQPRHRAHLRASFTVGGLFGAGAWLEEARVQATARYRSRVALDNFGSLHSPGALHLDLGARAQLGREVRLGVEVQNLLNERRAQDFLQRPLPGRAFFVSVELRSGSRGDEGGGGA